MKKILFIEDELSKNISNILRIFGDILTEEIQEELVEKQKDEFGAENEEVKNIIEKNVILEVCYSFPEAVKILNERYKEFGLFIVDRNLSEEAYKQSEILNYADFLYEKYSNREGDYLLEIIKSNGKEWSNKFYFLTANSNDSLKCSDVFKDAYNFEKFLKNNILDKTSNKDREYLLNLIKDFKKGNFKIKFAPIFKLFENNYAKKVTDEFKFILENMTKTDNSSITANIGKLRLILEAICNKLATDLETGKLEMDVNCLNDYKDRNGHFMMSAMINKVIPKLAKELGGKKSIISKNSNLLYNMTSSLGSHIDEENNIFFLPSSYSVQSWVYALCDIILWIDKLLLYNK